MHEAIRGKFEIFDASAYRVGIVVAQFNADITEELLKSAQEMLATYRVQEKNVTIARVAGCVEIPVVLKAMAESKKFDCLVALGTVVRGDTPHFDYVCKIVSEGVLRVMMDYGMPVGFGVLTLENMEQAKARFGVGGGAVEAAVQTVKEIKNF
ncbi:MAG TPA: 6,7-dimethyl-8-ribityllumazine synthase [Patescibacteria group bacterium]|nr:6,7-dimethyl-8-ribityllumazine synthase [Patescibacteria group bacterium]